MLIWLLLFLAAAIAAALLGYTGTATAAAGLGMITLLFFLSRSLESLQGEEDREQF